MALASPQAWPQRAPALGQTQTQRPHRNPLAAPVVATWGQQVSALCTALLPAARVLARGGSLG